MPAAAGVRRVAPHPRTRLGHVRRFGDPGSLARRLALVARPFLPGEIAVVDDIPAHPRDDTLRRVAEPRPVALPPSERTIGQLVAESIRFYGDRFWVCLALGLAPAAVAVVFENVSHHAQLLLAPTLGGALISATFVRASVLVLDAMPSRERLVISWLMGWLVFAPAPFLVLLYVLPGLVWLAALGLVVPVLVAEGVPVRLALPRAWRLARADFVHALGSLFTLAVVVLLSQSVLVFVLRDFGDAVDSVALFLSSVVLSPLLLIGTALLYVDQAARVE